MAVPAALTFRIAVERTVVGASVGVRVPKAFAAAAERRKLALLLLQLLLHQGSQGFDVPTE